MIAERIRGNIAREYASFDGLEIPTTLSMGVSSLKEGDATSSLFKRVDRALYRAKKGGRK